MSRDSTPNDYTPDTIPSDFKNATIKTFFYVNLLDDGIYRPVFKLEFRDDAVVNYGDQVYHGVYLWSQPQDGASPIGPFDINGQPVLYQPSSFVITPFSYNNVAVVEISTYEFVLNHSGLNHFEMSYIPLSYFLGIGVGIGGFSYRSCGDGILRGSRDFLIQFFLSLLHKGMVAPKCLQGADTELDIIDVLLTFERSPGEKELIIWIGGYHNTWSPPTFVGTRFIPYYPDISVTQILSSWVGSY